MFFKGAISADSHILEPLACFTDHIDPEFRDRAPRIELDSKGRHVYMWGAKYYSTLIAR